MKRVQAGFSLIELLVVITIIGILAAVLTVNFTDSRTVAKNRAMQAEFKEVQLAIELYRSQNGNYPVADGVVEPPGLVPDYIAELPETSDSANGNCQLNYTSDGNSYKYTAAECLGGIESAAEGMQPDDELARCPSFCNDCARVEEFAEDEMFYTSFAVYSQGAQCQ